MSIAPYAGRNLSWKQGFWFGTGNVSYALGAALSVFNLIWYWLIFGMSFWDNSIFWWLGANGVISVVARPG